MLNITHTKILRATVVVTIAPSEFNQNIAGACLDEENSTLEEGGVPIQVVCLREFVEEVETLRELPDGTMPSNDVLTFLAEVVSQLEAETTEILFVLPDHCQC